MEDGSVDGSTRSGFRRLTERPCDVSPIGPLRATLSPAASFEAGFGDTLPAGFDAGGARPSRDPYGTGKCLNRYSSPASRA